VIELNQAEHRDTISTTRFFEILIGIVGEKPLKNIDGSMSILSGALGQLAFGTDSMPSINDANNSNTASTL